jgi:hypothetical protein
VLTYWPYQDPLIQTYTLPYLKIMAENPDLSIWLVCLQPENKKISPTDLAKIQHELIDHRITLICLTYKPLSLSGLINTLFIFFRLLYLSLSLKINAIHAWATPAGALGVLISKLLSIELVIDSYEPHAEAMVENGTWKKNGFAHRFLFYLERVQTHHAKIVIAATEGMRQYASIKYKKIFNGNFFVKPACVDMTLFSNKNIKNSSLLEKLKLNDKIVCVYAGKFGGIYQDKEVFDFIKVCSEYWGDDFRVLILSAHNRVEIDNFCISSGVDPSIIELQFVPHQKVPDYLGLGDFAVTPVKPVPTKKYCTPIKDGEYWALGLPIVIPDNISDDSAIISRHDAGVILKDFSRVEYSKAVRKLDEILSRGRNKNYEDIRMLAIKYRSYDIAKSVYSSIYN